MRPPTPREHAAILGASYALVTLTLLARDHLARWRARQHAEPPPEESRPFTMMETDRRLAPLEMYGARPGSGYWQAPDGTVFVGSREWIAAAQARHEGWTE